MCLRSTNANETIAQNKIMELFSNTVYNPYVTGFENYVTPCLILLILNVQIHLMQHVLCSTSYAARHGVYFSAVMCLARLFYDNILNNVLKYKFNQWSSVYIQSWKRVHFVTVLSMCFVFDEQYANTNINRNMNAKGLNIL